MTKPISTTTVLGRSEEQESPVVAALKCAYHLLQQRIISRPSDMTGILLFGTKRTKFLGEDDSKKGGLTYANCYLLLDLDVPSAADVKALRMMVEDEATSREILTPSEKPISMPNVLFCANQIFTTKAPNFTSRRLFLITDEDDPHANDRSLRSAATIRARDLYDLGVGLELFPISRVDHVFDRSKFYDVWPKFSSGILGISDGR
jgi:ATP-dependent DNA helicase 2 subunit 1